MATRRLLPAFRLGENANLALVSVAIAMVAWVFAKNAEMQETTLTVPVVAMGLDSRVEARVSPARVDVRIRYPRDLESSISSGNFRFQVDTADLRDGLGLDWRAKDLPLTEKMLVTSFRGRRRIDLLKAGGDSNSVRVELRANAQPALVEPVVVGADRMKPGFQLVTPVRVIPREVYVTGSPESLAALPRDEATSRIRLLTEPLNVADRTGMSLETVGIQLPPGVDLVGRPSRGAEVALEVQEVQTIREIAGVLLDFQALSPDAVRLEYSCRSTTVTAYGPASLLQGLGPSSFEATLVRPAEEVPDTERELPLEVRLAPGVTDEVRAKVTVKAFDPKTLPVRYVAATEPLATP